MGTWVTPEEMERKRKRNKTLLYILLPIAAIIISATMTILANNF